jgi:hypothetical protein
MLAHAVVMACEIRGMTFTDAAEEMGFSGASLTRLRQGQHLSPDALASLVAWLFPQRIPHWVIEAPK